MPALDLNSIAALLVSALLLTWFWARRRSSGAPRKPAEEDLDTVQDWPPQVVRVLTLAERQAYDLLRKSLPGRLVLAQVPLARFISVPTRNSYTEWLNRAGRLSVDLVVCDHSSRVIAAIDIRAPNETARTRQRHARMGEVLRAAGVVVHEWNAQALPTASQVRTAFMPDSMHGKGAEAEMAIGPGGKRLLPVPEMTEVLATGDAAAESAGMPLEPVSSDYFDDLDVLARSGSGRA